MRHRLSLEIARRLMHGESGGRRLAGPAVKVATAAVALGMVIMIVSVAVGHGFKREVRNKIVGFGSHIQIASLDLNSSFETAPINRDTLLESDLRSVDGVTVVQPYVTKPGIIKTDSAFLGIALKGVDAAYDWSFVSSVLVEGSVADTPDTAKSSDIVLSRIVCDEMGLKLGDPIRVFFVTDGIRARRFELKGIFDSHMEEVDRQMAFVDMRQLVGLNNWSDSQISGYEILVADFERLDGVVSEVAARTVARRGAENEFLRVREIRDLQPQIFGWLNLLDKNIVVILVLIIAVAGLNMVSGLLILILEHTNTIGIMKAMGATNADLRQVFVTMALFIVGRGLLIGDAIGLALCGLQKLTGVARLDPANYYLDTVPIGLTLEHFLLLNIGTALAAFAILLWPSNIVASISPAKSIRFN